MRELAVRSSVGLGKGSGTPFINIKFRIRPFCAGSRVKQLTDTPIEVRTQLERFLVMKKAILALATVATIAVTALATPSPAQAGWRGGGWGGGWGPGLAGGLIAGAVIGGIASNAYAYDPWYGYGGPGYGYGGGYAPAYYGGGYQAGYGYGYAPAYYGGYTTRYAPAYYGPRGVIRRAYAYGGPRYYRGYRDRW